MSNKVYDKTMIQTYNQGVFNIKKNGQLDNWIIKLYINHYSDHYQ